MTQTNHLNRVLFLTGFALSLTLGLTGDQILRNVYDSSNTALRVNVVVGGGGGSGDITDVWGCTTGNCNALTAASGDSLNAAAADTTRPVKESASDPGTCTVGEAYYNTTDNLWKVCAVTNTWRPVVIVSGTLTDGAVLIFSGTTGLAIASACTVDGGGIMTCGTSGPGAFIGPDGTCDSTITASGQGGICQDTTNDGVYCKDAAACSKLAYVESNRLTSANVATMVSDETGSGLVVLGTSPTLTTPIVSGKVNMDGGTVNDNDCTSEQGRFWFDDTDNQFEFCNANSGAPTVLSGSGAPTDATYITQTANGTLSAEQALSSLSTGIMRVATTTGVITSLTDSAGIAANISDETGSGALMFATSPTNVTLDAEGTGNTITAPTKIWLPAAGCNNTTAAAFWDTPTSGPAVAACVTGTNTQKGVLDFADSSDLSAQQTLLLPSDFTGAIDAKFKWLTSATSGDVVWQLQTICVADAETDDPAFNTASTVTDTAKGTTLQTNDASITGVTITGCAAGELLHLKVRRDAAHASDNLAATARLIGVELTMRRAM